MSLSEWQELERLVRKALEEADQHPDHEHPIVEALKLTGAFAASVQEHWSV